MEMKKNELVKLILANKNFQLSNEILKSPADFDVKEVYRQGNITYYDVNPTEILLENLYLKLSELSEIKIKNYKSCIDFFRYCYGFFSFEKENWYTKTQFIGKHFIPYIIIKFKIDCNEIQTEKLNPTEAHSPEKLLLVGLLELIDRFQFNEKQIYVILTKSFDLKLEYYNQVLSYAKNFTQNAIAFIETYFGGQIEPYENIYRLILVGICRENGITSLDKLTPFYEDENKQYLIINAISQITFNNETEFNQLTSFAEASIKNEKNQLELIFFYSNLIEKKDNDYHTNQCYSRLKDFLNSKNENLSASVLHQLNYTNVSQELIIESLTIFLDNPAHSPKLYEKVNHNYNVFDGILNYKITNSKLFFEFLRIFVEKTGYIKEQILDYSIKNHVRKSLDDTLDFLIRCLSDVEGKIRHLGWQVMKVLQEEHPNTTFGEKLNGLSVEELQILILSISMMHTGSFKEALRTVITLLYHPNTEVQKLIFGVIFDKFNKEDGILALFEEELIESNEKEVFIEAFRKNEESFFIYRQKKKEIKEFSPANTHHKYFKQFQELFYKKWSKTLQDGIKNDTIIGVLGGETVLVMKGGGWRMNKDNPIQQMQHFQSSALIPAWTFINPDRENIEIGAFFSHNLSDKQLLESWLKKFLLENI
ncbi:MAG: hypothetical protein ACOVO2_25945 [Emticicia sp.]|uniref:hypothetical protein n=1 Tax=Emticicia sp. TaxID=1930953 RepID=UPI003BA5A2A0